MSTERAFGRLVAPDSRDAHFRMKLVLDPLRDKYFPKGIPPGSRYYHPGPLRDQGQTGCCTAFGTTLRIESAPVMQPLPGKITPYDLYRQIVLLDEFPENDHEATAPDAQLQAGSSVRAALKAAQTLGCFPTYLWADSVEDVRAWHLAGFGGVVLGLQWKSGMMQTDSDGFIHYTGQVEGGHCIGSVGWTDLKKVGGKIVPAMEIQNSWGAWGYRGTGRAWMAVDEFGTALADQGEAGAPTEVKVKA